MRMSQSENAPNPKDYLEMLLFIYMEPEASITNKLTCYAINGNSNRNGLVCLISHFTSMFYHQWYFHMEMDISVFSQAVSGPWRITGPVNLKKRGFLGMKRMSFRIYRWDSTPSWHWVFLLEGLYDITTELHKGFLLETMIRIPIFTNKYNGRSIGGFDHCEVRYGVLTFRPRVGLTKPPWKLTAMGTHNLHF